MNDGKIKIEDQGNGNGKAKIPKEALELITGLGSVCNYDHIDMLLEELQTLSYFQVILNDDQHFNPKITKGMIDGVLIRQSEIIEKIRNLISGQTRVIRKIQELAGVPLHGDSVKVDDESLAAWKSLVGLVSDDGTGYSDISDRSGIRALAIGYGWDPSVIEGLLSDIPPFRREMNKASDPQLAGTESEATPKVEKPQR